MCATCGCGGDDHTHTHDHSHDHAHDHTHDSAGRIVRLERDVLDKNNKLAERNRGWLDAREVLAINVMSSPGAGKTTLLERTIRDLHDSIPITVIEGDQETSLDADRIQAAGCKALQINTGSGCHLDADMLSRAMKQLDPARGSLMIIENVGNLVCPALFDLGERAKIVLVSVTEGDDKPLKYPHMFRAGDVLVLNKIDLLPHVRFDVERFLANARRVNPRLRPFQLSAQNGDGLDAWYGWLRTELSRRAEA